MNEKITVENTAKKNKKYRHIANRSVVDCLLEKGFVYEYSFNCEEYDKRLYAFINTPELEVAIIEIKGLLYKPDCVKKLIKYGAVLDGVYLDQDGILRYCFGGDMEKFNKAMELLKMERNLGD